MIKQKMVADQIQAMKSKNAARLETLRYILAQIKNEEIEKKQDLTDEEAVQILRKEAKKLQDSIVSFEKGDRADLAAEYKAQLEILSEYLPQEISEAELKQEIQKIIQANQDLYNKNPSALIGMCVGQLKSKASPSRISSMVRNME